MINYLVKSIWLLLFLLNSLPLFSQNNNNITLEQCYEWSRDHYPLIQQLNILEKITAFNLDNASKARLPQLAIKGQITYQSAVTRLPIEITNLAIPTVSKGQYKLYGEVYQPLTNRGIVKQKQATIHSEAVVEQQRIEVDLYQLRERINQLFFGVLLLDGKLVQTNLLLKDLDASIEKTQAAIDNGTAIESNGQLIQAEMIKVRQNLIDQQAQRSAYLAMLATLTGQTIDDQTTLIKPAAPADNPAINRPELRLLLLQENDLDLKFKQINQKIIPGLGLFLQGGFGRPALNFLDNDFSPYYLGGIKFNWNLSNLYTSKNEREILNLQKLKIHSSRDLFLLNTKVTRTLEDKTKEKFRQLLDTDNELIALRAQLTNTAEVQLTNGLMTALDYLSYLNAEDQAKQNKLLHEIQLLLSQFNLKTISGN